MQPKRIFLGFIENFCDIGDRSANMRAYTRETEPATGQTQAGERKGINLKLSPKDYARAERIKEQYGYKSLYEIAMLAVVSFLNHVDRIEQRKEDDLPADVSEEIAQMFNDYIVADQPQDVTRYKRVPNRSQKF